MVAVIIEIFPGTIHSKIYNIFEVSNRVVSLPQYGEGGGGETTENAVFMLEGKEGFALVFIIFNEWNTEMLQPSRCWFIYFWRREDDALDNFISNDDLHILSGLVNRI